jgi:hypothetical protein
LILFRLVCSIPDGKRQLAHTYCYMMLYGAGHKKSRRKAKQVVLTLDELAQQFLMYTLHLFCSRFL